MKITRTLLSLVLPCITLSAASGAGLLNGDFETPIVPGMAAYYTSAPAGFLWTVVPGTGIDHVRTFWQASSGAQSVDLNGFSPGSIYQDFNFSTAGNWDVKFDLSANPDPGEAGIKTVRVDFGVAGGPLTTLGTFTSNSAGKTLSNMQWLTVTTPDFSVDTSTLYRLEFTSLTPGASGPAIDNVRAVVVPEPSSLALLCGGLVFGLLKVRKSKHSKPARR
jgi:hypothetical protein